MKLPEVDIKELEKIKEDNFRDRLNFIDRYTEWIKKTNSKKWSSQQKDLVNEKT